MTQQTEISFLVVRSYPCQHMRGSLIASDTRSWFVRLSPYLVSRPTGSHSNPSSAGKGLPAVLPVGDFTKSDEDKEEPLKPGDVLDGRYRIEKELGRGGIGVVYKATDLENQILRRGQDVARKVGEGPQDASTSASCWSVSSESEAAQALPTLLWSLSRALCSSGALLA